MIGGLRRRACPESPINGKRRVWWARRAARRSNGTHDEVEPFIVKLCVGSRCCLECRAVHPRAVEVSTVDPAIRVEETTDRGGRWNRTSSVQRRELHTSASERGRKTIEQVFLIHTSGQEIAVGTDAEVFDDLNIRRHRKGGCRIQLECSDWMELDAVPGDAGLSVQVIPKSDTSESRREAHRAKRGADLQRGVDG